MSWLFWQMGSAPYLGGGFGHFYAYAPEKYEYPINRYAMEVKRQLDLLDKNLESREYLCGDDYNISDIAVHSWYGTLVLNNAYNASEFLEVESYKHLGRWAKQITERPAYKRGSLVNRKPNGPDDKEILERHDASDIKL
jgi:GST-like protein